MLADRDGIAVLQRVLLDQAPIHIGAVGAVHVFKKRIVEDRYDLGVLPADRQIVNLNVVLGFTADRHLFLVELELANGIAVVR